MCSGIIQQQKKYSLPEVRGKYRFDSDLSKVNWFRIGGKADIVFWPEDEADLSYFLHHKPEQLKIYVFGVGSNLLVRDGGVRGCVIRLGKNFTQIKKIDDTTLRVGAGLLSSQLAKYCSEVGLAGAEFLAGIPGTIGGAIAMNAGAYGNEFSDICQSVGYIDKQGEEQLVFNDDIGFDYRHNPLAKNVIFTSVVVRLQHGNAAEITDRVAQIMRDREASQPIKSCTSGSTFRNPDPVLSDGKKAWQLIDEAGCRGATMGDAQVSEKHCNFLINRGNATGEDMEKLGLMVQNKVQQKCGIMMHWEVKIVGEAKDE